MLVERPVHMVTRSFLRPWDLEGLESQDRGLEGVMQDEVQRPVLIMRESCKPHVIMKVEV